MPKIILLIYSLLVFTSPFCFAEKPHGPEAEVVKVQVGSKDGKMQFLPSKLTFERGHYYKLLISNPSADEHYFTSDAFATHIFTRKVEVINSDGKTVAEIHGAVNDMELKPGATVEWYFYPMTNGKDLKLFCHKDGHEAAGMVGSIDIIGKAPFSR